MALDLSALRSLSGSLDDLIVRLSDLARSADDDEEIGIELREVERQLQTANRRLAKAVRRAE